MNQKDIIFSCPTLRRELEAARNAEGSRTPVVYLPRQLHAEPKKLHEYLQDLIDHTEGYDRILLCVSGCGNSTTGLLASNAELVIPRTSDCIDILLSGGAPRQQGGIYLTESWMSFMRESGMDLTEMTQRLGKAEAVARMRRMFAGFTDFYIIDTGAYDLAPVQNFAKSLVEVLDGTLTVVKGKCQILREIAGGNIGANFIVVPKGQRKPPITLP